MKQRFALTSSDDITKIVNVEAPTMDEIKLKLLVYAINNLELDIDNILEDLVYNEYFSYQEIEDDDDTI